MKDRIDFKNSVRGVKAMKSLTAIAALMLFVCTASAEDVKSVNIVGYKSSDLPSNTFIQVALPFEAFDCSLLGIFGTNQLVKANKAGNADNVYVWDPLKNAGAGGYDRYYQKLDNLFYSYDTGLESNAMIYPGMGFWLQSPKAADDRNITLMGEVIPDGVVTTPIVVGFQMLGYSFSSDITLGDTAFMTNGATKNNKASGADNIYVWTGSNYNRYYLKPDGQWYNYETALPAQDDVLSLGQGFWYQSKAPFSWIETNRYLQNL